MNCPYWPGSMRPGQMGSRRDHGRRPRRLERLEAHPIEPGRAAPLAITDQEGCDPNATVGGSLEHEHDLGPVGLAPMAGTGREDAPAPPTLDLIRPGHRGFHRIKADCANPATEPVPSPRLEPHLLTERRVREVRGRHAQGLLPLVDDPSIGLDRRLGPVGHHLPAVEEGWRFEARVPHRRDAPLARIRPQRYAYQQDRQRHDSHGLASVLSRWIGTGSPEPWRHVSESSNAMSHDSAIRSPSEHYKGRSRRSTPAPMIPHRRPIREG